MSVTVAIKDKDIVYLGADTMVTYGDSKRYLRHPSSQKIWKIMDTENCIMGGCGYLRDINLIHYCTAELVPEAAVLKGDINIRTIMMNAVPTIFNTISEYSKIADPEEKGIKSSFIWACKDKCFVIYPDGNVEEVEDYAAIGSGADAALASLKNSEGMPILDRLYMALEAAADISLYVADPFVFINTDDTNLCDFTDEEEPIIEVEPETKERVKDLLNE